jgi:hypothetical protein
MEGLQRDNTIGVNAFIAINSRIVGQPEVELSVPLGGLS